MKNWIFVVTLLALVGLAGTADADQPGTIAQDTLAEMGLDDLQPMTEQAGLAVRGHGFAFVSGFGFPAFPSPASDFSFAPYKPAEITIFGFSSNSLVIVSAYALTK
jgi:hypothetical protein